MSQLDQGSAQVNATPAAADIPVKGAEPIALDAKPAIGRNFRLQWEEVQKAWVLLYPEGMVKLNASAGEILRRCDGNLTVAGIVAELEKAFGTTGLLADVQAFFGIAHKQGWIDTGGTEA
ncbi:MAG: pyrroloquinoline quinone biosynthesis peptide chaperone PqqD [Lautropia sp.]|nr:pyrroloquinoline quinone biosynthesis peptide chaperone PqqD [Lautropia sp.]